MAGRGASPETIAQVAEEAERIGLDSVWAWERLMRPTVPIAMGGPGGPVMEAPEDFAPVYDPIETLSYVAARTSRITLGTSVLDALFQSPVILARRLATLDRLSDGRLVAGIGQGWMEQEFEAAGVSMRRRGAGFEEHLLGHARGLGARSGALRRAASTASPRPTSARSRSAREARRLLVGAGVTAGARTRRTARCRTDPGDLRLGHGPRRASRPSGRRPAPPVTTPTRCRSCSR